jgi:uncharacterized protein
LKRLVVDASTLVSGVASRTKGGALASILEAVLEAYFETIACPHLIDEFRRSLRNRYFQERFAAADLAEVVTAVESIATMHTDPTQIELLLRDPDDDYLVALARQTGADAIVTGDKDLLEHPGGLHPPAIDARAACKLLGLT